jgi:4'-phosphopantetheinyl transferase
MIQLQPTWPAAPSHIQLSEGEIHLWRAHIDAPTALADCRSVLSADELIRAARFHFEEDATRFIATRGAVRMILSRYLGGDPSALIFDSGPHGKPFVLHPFMDIRFNVSHSRDIAMVAVTRGREVGVDVEYVQSDIQFEPIAEHYFDPRENWDLRTAPEGERTSRFFELWTQKEARLKAEGVGLVGEGSHRCSWGVRNLVPAEGYAGAVASEGEDWKLACWEWSL